MAVASRIEWTESTWNPATGCTKVSPGCTHCYAERMAKRLKAMGQRNYVNGFALTLQEHMVEIPLSWRKPQTVFVNSMSDLFHKDVPLSFIQRVFDVILKANWHTFQLLTKRSERLVKLNSKLHWPENLWVGVSVENADYKYRIDDLRQSDACVKFLSCEPLLGPLDAIDLSEIDWVVVGGESGPHSRPMDPDWVREIRNQCIEAEVAFFFKQWGGTNKKKAGRVLDGRKWDQMPKDKRNPRPSVAICG